MAKDPFLDDAMRGWIVNYASDNFWRVQKWYEFEDLVQDGYECYYRCRKRYRVFASLQHPSAADRRHFMRLVQTTFTNHIHKLSNRHTAQPEQAFSQFEDPQALEALFPQCLGDADLRLLLASAPREIVQLITLLSKEGVEAVKFLRSRLAWNADRSRARLLRRRLRETSNAYYCRRLGLDPGKVDLFDMLRNHLGLT